MHELRITIEDHNYFPAWRISSLEASSAALAIMKNDTSIQYNFPLPVDASYTLSFDGTAPFAHLQSQLTPNFGIFVAPQAVLPSMPGKATILELEGGRRALLLEVKGSEADVLIWNGKEVTRQMIPWKDSVDKADMIAYRETPWLIPSLRLESPKADRQYYAEWRLIKAGDILISKDAQGKERYEQVLKIEEGLNSTKRWVTSVSCGANGVSYRELAARTDSELAQCQTLLVKRDPFDGTIGQTSPRVASQISTKIAESFNTLISHIETGYSTRLEQISNQSTGRSLIGHQISDSCEARNRGRETFENLLDSASRFHKDFEVLRHSIEMLFSYVSQAHLPQATSFHTQANAALQQMNSYIWGNQELTFEQKLTQTLKKLDTFISDRITLNEQEPELSNSINAFRAQNASLLLRVKESTRLEKEPAIPVNAPFEYRTCLEPSELSDQFLGHLSRMCEEYRPKAGTIPQPGRCISAPLTIGDLRDALESGAQIITFRKPLDGQEKIYGFLIGYPHDQLPNSVRERPTVTSSSFAYSDMLVMDRQFSRDFPDAPRGIGPYALLESSFLHAATRGAQAMEAEVRIGHHHLHNLLLPLLGIPKPFATEVTTTPETGTREYWQPYYFSLNPEIRKVLQPLLVANSEEASTLLRVLDSAARASAQNRTQETKVEGLARFNEFVSRLAEAPDSITVRITGHAANATGSIKGFRDFVEQAFYGSSPAILFGDTEMLVMTDGRPQHDGNGKLIVREGVMSAGKYIRNLCPSAQCGGVVVVPDRGVQQLNTTDAGTPIQLEVMSNRPVVDDQVFGNELYVSVISRESHCRLRQPSEVGTLASPYDQEVDWCLGAALELAKPSQGAKAPLLFVYGGGATTTREIQKWADLGLPIVLVRGSGGAADAFLNNKQWISEQVDTQGRPQVFELDINQPHRMKVIMEEVQHRHSEAVLAGKLKTQPDIIGLADLSA